MKKELSRSPQNINGNTWYYEENDGIHIIHSFNGPNLPMVVQIKIPYKKLRATMKRLNKTRPNRSPVVERVKKNGRNAKIHK